MATVYIPLEHRELADTLVKKVDQTGAAVFSSYMELTCFAAMIGYFHHGDNIKYEEHKETGPEIPTRIYENNQKDGLAYLLALHTEKSNADILRDENENKCWGVIEKYSSAGLSIINDWMIDNPGTLLDGVETILSHMKTVAGKLNEEKDASERPQIFHRPFLRSF